MLLEFVSTGMEEGFARFIANTLNSVIIGEERRHVVVCSFRQT